MLFNKKTVRILNFKRNDGCIDFTIMCFFPPCLCPKTVIHWGMLRSLQPYPVFDSKSHLAEGTSERSNFSIDSEAFGKKSPLKTTEKLHKNLTDCRSFLRNSYNNGYENSKYWQKYVTIFIILRKQKCLKKKKKNFFRFFCISYS